MKTCTWCNKSLSEDSFGKRKIAKDGLNSHCKLCRSIKAKKYRSENKDKCAGYEQARDKPKRL